MLRPCSNDGLWLGLLRGQGARLQKVATTLPLTFNSKSKAAVYEKVIIFASELAADIDFLLISVM